ncbi:hypothetical protein JQ634_20730 [Bradyrhizobium sp. AUGA SZCCT0240]|jgi:hypothetical protein|uniref:hypothetical protein n=1 Tax=unclassified Bradyrhizobium TaxID=2631580 RepID=UPI001BA8751C|nr:MULTISPECIES: hypothetical protein [unclassified Bradyrhizobium]MBR1200035.1 hypothetical protein [Bradyrhizobium sp. AUGA SZCCT0158]MBR1239488.1 hypothetical protein [Bradyrhizobium sp. AUGA SZCCT0274]MBR1249614.1 hypothetical protein [Bradyrhizobium sp. AUGA SZCCT0169]MBR1256117.1 hypothetical protein [Bradyrhizobium sp. AUGA SZCCT0240]
MNVQINDAYAARFEDSALSDNELDIVSGGERHQVSKAQYEMLLAVRMVVAGTYKG